MVRISKTIVAGISALAMAAAIVLPASPASAAWRGGGGGWHGGGWGGGWHGGGWRGGGWHGGGWAGRGVWHGGYWRNGYWNNGWWGPAIAAGVIGGAAIATYPYWGGGYGYGYGGGGCWQYQPVYDAYGNYLGQQSVNVC